MRQYTEGLKPPTPMAPGNQVLEPVRTASGLQACQALEKANLPVSPATMAATPTTMTSAAAESAGTMKSTPAHA